MPPSVEDLRARIAKNLEKKYSLYRVATTARCSCGPKTANAFLFFGCPICLAGCAAASGASDIRVAEACGITSAQIPSDLLTEISAVGSLVCCAPTSVVASLLCCMVVRHRLASPVNELIPLAITQEDLNPPAPSLGNAIFRIGFQSLAAFLMAITGSSVGACVYGKAVAEVVRTSAAGSALTQGSTCAFFSLLTSILHGIRARQEARRAALPRAEITGAPPTQGYSPQA